jgi:hypothetical protein
VSTIRRQLRRGAPIEFWLLLGCVFQGSCVATGVAIPVTLKESLPQPFRIVWAAFMVAGGLMALIGWVYSETYRIGLALVTTACLTYATALLLHGPSGYVAAVLQSAFAIACAAQIRLVTKEFESVRSKIAEGDRTIEPPRPE